MRGFGKRSARGIPTSPISPYPLMVFHSMLSHENSVEKSNNWIIGYTDQTQVFF